MQHTTETAKQYQCRHIFTDGHRCASLCLRGEEFCYYHHTTRKPTANPKQRRRRHSTFHLPLPEDRSSIQSSIGEVLQRIAANDIDPRRAGLLLYGLQIASLNLPKPQPNSKPTESQTANQTVEEITIDPTLGILAPRAEVSANTQRKSSVALLIESMLRSEKEEEETALSSQPREATIVETLQATEDCATPAIKRSVIPTELPSRCPPKKASSRPKRSAVEEPALSLAKGPPHLPLPVLPNATPKTVISTGDPAQGSFAGWGWRRGALAAAAEKSASLPQPRTRLPYVYRSTAAAHTVRHQDYWRG
jgi:hypothetical protein